MHPLDHRLSCPDCGRVLNEPAELVKWPFVCENCREVQIRNAQWKLLWSRRIVIGYVLLGLSFGIVGVIITTRTPTGLSPLAVFGLSCAESLIGAYSAWSIFWGVPRVWKWWLRLSRSALNTLQTIPLSGMLLPAVPLFLTFYIPIVFGCAYGFFGGGFYESARCKRIASQAGLSKLPR